MAPAAVPESSAVAAAVDIAVAVDLVAVAAVVGGEGAEAVVAVAVEGARMSLEQAIDSVLPLNFSVLGKREQQYFQDLQDYATPWLYEKLVKDGEVQTQEDYHQRFTEFKKYVALLRISQQPLAMVSQKVDALWHQFILFTRQYHEFSRIFYGKYIHHDPTTSITPLAPKAEENFHHWYHTIYGPLPEVWKDV